MKKTGRKLTLLIATVASILLLFGMSTMASAAVTGFHSLKQTGIKTKAVSVTWSKANGVKNYEVYYRYEGSGSEYILHSTTTKNSATISCQANSLLKVKVVAKAEYGILLDEVFLTTTCKTLPTTPKIKESKKWNAIEKWAYTMEARPNVSGHRIKIYNFRTKKTQALTVSNYASFTILRNSAYKVRVTPYTIVNGKQYFGNSVVRYPLQSPIIEGTAAGKAYIQIRWDKVPGAKYEVYVKVPGGKWVRRTTTSKNTYRLNGIRSGVGYQFKVKVRKKAGGKVRTATSKVYIGRQYY